MTNTILIPIIIAQMVINSKNLKRLNGLPKIIIQNIKSGITLERLSQIIKIEMKVIQECVDILSNDGIIFYNPLRRIYQLTEKGEEIFNKMEFIKNFNNSKKEIVIDKYLNRVYFKNDIQEKIINTQDKSTQKLENRYFKTFLLYNINPLNSMELFNEKVGNDVFEEEELEISINLIKKMEGYIVSKLDLSKSNEKKSVFGKMVAVERDILKGKVEIQFDSVNKVKNILDDLKRVGNIKPEFLTDTAKEILMKEKLAKTILEYYYDPEKDILTDKNIVKKYNNKNLEIIKTNTKAKGKISEKLEEDTKIKFLKEQYKDDLNLKIKEIVEKTYEEVPVENVVEFYKGVKANDNR